MKEKVWVFLYKSMEVLDLRFTVVIVIFEQVDQNPFRNSRIIEFSIPRQV